MEKRQIIDLLLENEIKEISKNDRVRISLINFKGTLCVLKQYYGRNLSSVYSNIVELQKKKKCEYVAYVYGCTYYDNDTYIIEEWISGETLEERISHKGCLTEEEFVDVSTKLCNALIYLHSNKPPIIHRDIKPQNIMLLAGGGVKLFDFDIARTQKKSQMSDTGLAVGSEGYISPEQRGAGQTGPFSDIYSLGVTMCRMLSDSKPVFKDGKLHVPKECGRFAKIIRKSCAFDPNSRYKDAESLRNALTKNNDNVKKVLVVVVIIFIWIMLIIAMTEFNGKKVYTLNEKEGGDFFSHLNDEIKNKSVQQSVEYQEMKDNSDISGNITVHETESLEVNGNLANDTQDEMLQKLLERRALAESRPTNVEEIPGVNSELIEFIKSNKLINDFRSFLDITELLGEADIYGVSHVSRSQLPKIYASDDINWMKFCWMSSRATDPLRCRLGVVIFYVEPDVVSNYFNRDTSIKDVISLLGDAESSWVMSSTDGYGNPDRSDFNFFDIKELRNEYQWKYIYEEYTIYIRFIYSEEKICDYVQIVFDKN